MSIISNETLSQLKEVQALINQTGRQLTDHDYRQQYHVDLSPLGWHVGHCAFLETFWLRETLLGDNAETAAHHALYFPKNLPKPQRGPALPEQHAHIDWCERLQATNHELMCHSPTSLSEQQITKNDYLARFLLQHHSQHYENMAMVLTQRQLKKQNQYFQPSNKLDAAFPTQSTFKIDAEEHSIGYENGVDAFDNEVPAKTIRIQAFTLSTQPVSNNHWLAFIEDGGYQKKEFWSDETWQWRCDNNIEHPEQWLKNEDSDWFGIDAEGPHMLADESAVSGINYFEAKAFIKWLRNTSNNFDTARLPHEYELEVAQHKSLTGIGQVWEWCENTFHPYEGFRPFPYDDYSKPWFDEKHYSLRGSSPYTQTAIRRPSFRNFYNPDKRHIFSGLRLAL